MILILTLGIVIFTLFWLIYDNLTHLDYPPGPLRLPILGCLFKMTRLSPLPAVAFQQLSRIYGDVFYLKIGFSEMVVFNSEQTIQEIRNHESCNLRCPEANPMLWERSSRKNLGIVFGNGKQWQTLRRFTIRTLRDFGFGKAVPMDLVINQEVYKFINCIELEMALCGKNGDIRETNHYFNLSLVNIVWRLITGVNYDLNDEKLKKLLELSNEYFKCSNFGANLTSAFPFLFEMFPDLLGKKELCELLKKLNNFMEDSIHFRKQTKEYLSNPNCYVDVFLSKIEESEKVDSAFTHEQLVMCLLDLFQAGSDTGSTALKYCVLQMLINPEIQAQIHKELDANVGINEEITFNCRKKLPFTHATLLECMRFAAVVPLLIPTTSSKDIYFKGYFIKKGIPLLTNAQAVHMDKRIWGDADNFRPERFLTKDGEICGEMKSHLLSYGYGPRQCLGNIIADNVIFIYFATILKKFKLEKTSETEILSTEPLPGFTNVPKPFKVKYISRN